ncbi:nickel-dependent hydrogenase large subunit [Stygiolobus caldivivus]|uniref:Cytochrome-c3 hydrogenase n=1 Tax=Stygiolobus caldivivus TaxID=2824673 RepID=A0A8D5ZHX9_9CREN|nr:nickel-dependent hydrogenase large subunit [Stygiolobus caldivivus]BCU68807.1 cytochrome-c3 hydrogenase [Stygiolobus caldivivus]
MNEKVISPFNRVEGDLDVKLIYDKNKIVDVKFSSNLFRGIEVILKGKNPLDSLVITPRICGICGASHLYAAVSALEMAYKAEVPFNAVKIRNVMSMAEICQNDVRHTYLMFLIDVTNKRYKDTEFYPEIVKKLSPMIGTSYREAFKWSKKYTEIYAIFGGQWPHGSAMVPGGITADPQQQDIVKAKGIIRQVTKEFWEKTVLGGPLDQFLETVRSLKDLEQWSEDYKEGDISLIYKFGVEMGLDHLGYGSGILMSYGHLPVEEYSYDSELRDLKRRFRGGLYFISSDTLDSIDQRNILEFVNFSHYTYSRGDTAGLHPFEGETVPEISDGKYTFTKCFRYRYKGSLVAPEVGALSMMSISASPLITDMVKKKGPSVLARVISRIVRVSLFHKLMEEELDQFVIGKPTYKKVNQRDGTGFGLVEAARGALGHWVVIKDGKISNYQIVTPTQINMGPEDPWGNKSHLAKALIGVEVADPRDPIEAYHVIRAQDPCLVCTVH